MKTMSLDAHKYVGLCAVYCFNTQGTMNINHLDVKDFVTEYGKQYNEYHNSEVAFKLNPAEMYDEFSKNYYCPDKNEHDTIVPKETTQKEIKQIVKSLNLEEKTILIDMIENQVEKLNKNELTLLRERQKINSKTTEMKNATEVLM